MTDIKRTHTQILTTLDGQNIRTYLGKATTVCSKLKPHAKFTYKLLEKVKKRPRRSTKHPLKIWKLGFDQISTQVASMPLLDFQVVPMIT